MNVKLTLEVESEYPAHWNEHKARVRAIAQWHEQAAALGVKPVFNTTVVPSVDWDVDDRPIRIKTTAEVEITR